MPNPKDDMRIRPDAESGYSADLYGDEADLTLRKKKKADPKAAAKKKKKRGRFAKSSKKKVDKKSFLLFRKKIRFVAPVAIHAEEGRTFGTVYIFGRRARWRVIIAIILVLFFALSAFSSNSTLNAQTTTIAAVGLPAGLENYKFMVLSDLNGRRFGDRQSSLLRTIESQGCRVLLLLGDMVGKKGDPEPLYELLEGLPRNMKVYFICGDNDPGPYVDMPRSIEGTLSQIVLEDWILGCIERGAVFVDRPTELVINNTSVWLTPATLMNMNASDLKETWEDQVAQEEEGVINGLETDYVTLPSSTYRYRIAQSYYNTLKVMKEDDFYIALSHEVPSDDLINAASSPERAGEKYLSTPDLILAGHYCGGVWQLPLFGPFFIPDDTLDRNGWFPARSHVVGLRTTGETQVFTTGGLTRNQDTIFPFRLFNNPQISVIRFTATLPTSMLEE